MTMSVGLSLSGALSGMKAIASKKLAEIPLEQVCEALDIAENHSASEFDRDFARAISDKLEEIVPQFNSQASNILNVCLDSCRVSTPHGDFYHSLSLKEVVDSTFHDQKDKDIVMHSITIAICQTLNNEMGSQIVQKLARDSVSAEPVITVDPGDVPAALEIFNARSAGDANAKSDDQFVNKLAGVMTELANQTDTEPKTESDLAAERVLDLRQMVDLIPTVFFHKSNETGEQYKEGLMEAIQEFALRNFGIGTDVMEGLSKDIGDVLMTLSIQSEMAIEKLVSTRLIE